MLPSHIGWLVLCVAYAFWFVCCCLPRSTHTTPHFTGSCLRWFCSARLPGRAPLRYLPLLIHTRVYCLRPPITLIYVTHSLLFDLVLILPAAYPVVLGDLCLPPSHCRYVTLLPLFPRDLHITVPGWPTLHTPLPFNSYLHPFLDVVYLSVCRGTTALRRPPALFLIPPCWVFYGAYLTLPYRLAPFIACCICLWTLLSAYAILLVDCYRRFAVTLPIPLRLCRTTLPDGYRC